MVAVADKVENERPVFPFTAIIGQEEMKLALILNVIDPRIGGVMIMGDRGTGKSTTIRAVADLLPAIKVAADDPFNSSITDFELMSETVKKAVEANEEVEFAYKKAYISLRTPKKQFAILQPSTKDRVDIGLNLK